MSATSVRAGRHYSGGIRLADRQAPDNPLHGSEFCDIDGIGGGAPVAATRLTRPGRATDGLSAGKSGEHHSGRPDRKARNRCQKQKADRELSGGEKRCSGLS